MSPSPASTAQAPPTGATLASCPPSGGLARILLRRSIGRPALLSSAAVIVANIALRERHWVHEWLGAYFNFHFVLIFVGPLAAGLGAWEGARLARSRELLQSSGQTHRALAAAAGAVLAWLLFVYAAGLLVVTVMVKAAGTPDAPGLVEAATLVPAAAFLALWVFAGVAAGYRYGSPLMAPLATVASFSVILVFYIVDYDLVRVGGASASLLGLAPYPARQAAQAGLYLATATWAVLLAARPIREPGQILDRLPTILSGGLALLLAGGLFFNNAPDFKDRPVRLLCSGAPPICLAPGYANHPERVRAVFDPLFTGLRQIGAPLPRSLRMGEVSEEDLVGIVSTDLALGDDSAAVSDLMTAYVRFSCDLHASPGLRAQWAGLSDWLQAQAGDPEALEYTSVDVLQTGTKDEQAAWLRNAIDRLRRCA